MVIYGNLSFSSKSLAYLRIFSAFFHLFYPFANYHLVCLSQFVVVYLFNRYFDLPLFSTLLNEVNKFSLIPTHLFIYSFKLLSRIEEKRLFDISKENSIHQSIFCLFDNNYINISQTPFFSQINKLLRFSLISAAQSTQ